MFACKACEARKCGVYLVVNEQFSGKRNEAGGHYGQTLIIVIYILIIIWLRMYLDFITKKNKKLIWLYGDYQ